jgi:hypothetical protein
MRRETHRPILHSATPLTNPHTVWGQLGCVRRDPYYARGSGCTDAWIIRNRGGFDRTTT